MTRFGYSQEKATLTSHVCEKQNLKCQNGKIWTDLCKTMQPMYLLESEQSLRGLRKHYKEFN